MAEEADNSAEVPAAEVAKTEGDAPKKVYKDKMLDPDYKGEKLPDSLKDGPATDRHCTDILCCLVFLAFLVAMFVCGIYGFANGDPLLLTYPFDSSGNQCGAPDDDAENYPYLYFVYPYSGYLTITTCLDECPDAWGDKLDCYENKKVLKCDFDLEDSFTGLIPPEKKDFYEETDISQLIVSKSKAESSNYHSYPADGYLERFCLPDADDEEIEDALDDINDEIDTDTLTKWLSDVANTWDAMLAVAAITIVVAALYLVFLRFCLGFVIWSSIIFIIAALCAFAYFLLWTRNNKYQEDNDEDTRATLLYVAIAIFCIAGIFTLYILCICNRIRLAVAIMKSGTLYIKDVPSSLLVPPIMFLVAVAIFVYWMFATIFIFSVGDIEQRDSGSAVATIEWDETTRRAYYFHFFGIFWLSAFLVALN
jgi:hypothetical protein